VRATGGIGGSLWRIDAHSAIDDVDYSTLSLGRSVDEYRRAYSAQNPVLPQAMAVMRPGDVACGSDFIDTRENKRTAFYSEWVRPQGYLHEMGGLLEARADFSAMLFVASGPGQRPFGMSERESFRVVIPHVRTALALSCRLQAGQQGELARSALAQRGRNRTQARRGRDADGRAAGGTAAGGGCAGVGRGQACVGAPGCAA
jgi:hypothetical protein